MAITNYAELVAAIPTWAFDNGQSVAAQTDNFIQLAQQRMQREIATTWLDAVQVSLPFITGQFIYALPVSTQYINQIVVDLPGGNTQVLQQKTLAFLQESYNPARIASSPDQVRYYSWYGENQFYVAATPGAGLSYRLNYRQIQPILSAANPTNYFITRIPDVFLNCVLIEVMKYKSDPEMLGIYEKYYLEGVQSLKDNYLGTTRDDFQYPGSTVKNQALTTEPS